MDLTISAICVSSRRKPNSKTSAPGLVKKKFNRSASKLVGRPKKRYVASGDTEAVLFHPPNQSTYGTEFRMNTCTWSNVPDLQVERCTKNTPYPGCLDGYLEYRAQGGHRRFHFLKMFKSRKGFI